MYFSILNVQATKYKETPVLRLILRGVHELLEQYFELRLFVLQMFFESYIVQHFLTLIYDTLVPN